MMLKCEIHSKIQKQKFVNNPYNIINNSDTRKIFKQWRRHRPWLSTKKNVIHA